MKGDRDMGRIDRSQARDRWWDLVKSAIDLQVP
jgi:hypothetical protein